jgi:antitoxin ParD1/3/4
MPNITRALPEPAVAELRRAVEAGEYASASKAVRDVPRERQLMRAQRQASIEELRRLWDEGVVSGDGEAFDIEELKAETRCRLEWSAEQG